MRLLNVLTAVFLTLCASSSVCAQRSDLQSWTLVTATAGIGERKEWLFYFEAQPRVGDDVSRLERLLIRPAVGYALSKDVSFLVGWTCSFGLGSR